MVTQSHVTRISTDRTSTLAFDQHGQNVDVLDLSWLVQQTIRRWPWVLATTVVFSLAAVAVILKATPIYRATVVLAPTSAQRGGGDLSGAGGLGGLAAIAGINLLPKGSEQEEAIAVLESREFTSKFVNSKHLMPELFPKKWNPATGTWNVDEAHQPTANKAFKYFNRKVRSVVTDKKTGLVTLQIDWRDRKEAADWANELVRMLNEEMRMRAITKATAAMHFLEEEVQRTNTVEGRTALSRLMEQQLNQRMLANVTPDYSFRIVDPAVAADADDPVWPIKAMVLLLGVLGGLTAGITLAWYQGSSSQRRASTVAGDKERRTSLSLASDV